MIEKFAVSLFGIAQFYWQVLGIGEAIVTNMATIIFVFIFWQKTKKNWHFLEKKQKKEKKKIFALYTAKSLPK